MPTRRARSFAEKIAEPLGMAIEQAAYGAHLIAASNMIRAIKAVSTERGRDPREFALFAFGGNGPLFAAGMAAALGMSRVVVPPSAGLFSSFGLLYADVEHHYARTFRRLLRQRRSRRDRARPGTRSREQASEQLAADGFTGDARAAAPLGRAALPGPDLRADRAGARRADRCSAWSAHLEEAFGAEHERTYGHRAGPDEPVELVAIQIVGAGPARRAPAFPSACARAAPEPAPPPPRRAYFGGDGSTAGCETPVLRRTDLAAGRSGPLIVEEYDATCVVPPGATRRASTPAATS